ncbi:predicted protein [Nematostella vectensis]|uniref:Uncharacterized protein n=1 Tax=Nematostella vectensis TaxID=45351 RepID=A7RMP0_NEMVE|nr:predicted protein [Nematostella vectensis]|eukprot:XP_001639364.1 predicted protein [Nematostella vectensis]
MGKTLSKLKKKQIQNWNSVPQNAWILQFSLQSTPPLQEHQFSRHANRCPIFTWPCPEWIEENLFHKLGLIVVQAFLENNLEMLMRIISQPNWAIEPLDDFEAILRSSEQPNDMMKQLEENLLDIKYQNNVRFFLEMDKLRQLELLITDSCDPQSRLRDAMKCMTEGVETRLPLMVTELSSHGSSLSSERVPTPKFDNVLPLNPTAPEESSKSGIQGSTLGNHDVGQSHGRNDEQNNGDQNTQGCDEGVSRTPYKNENSSRPSCSVYDMHTLRHFDPENGLMGICSPKQSCGIYPSDSCTEEHGNSTFMPVVNSTITCTIPYVTPPRYSTIMSTSPLPHISEVSSLNHNRERWKSALECPNTLSQSHSPVTNKAPIDYHPLNTNLSPLEDYPYPVGTISGLKLKGNDSSSAMVPSYVQQPVDSYKRPPKVFHQTPPYYSNSQNDRSREDVIQWTQESQGKESSSIMQTAPQSHDSADKFFLQAQVSETWNQNSETDSKDSSHSPYSRKRQHVNCPSLCNESRQANNQWKDGANHKDPTDNNDKEDLKIADTDTNANNSDEYTNGHEDSDLCKDVLSSDTVFNKDDKNIFVISCSKSDAVLASTSTDTTSSSPFKYFPIHGFTKAAMSPIPATKKVTETKPIYNVLPFHGLTRGQYHTPPESRGSTDLSSKTSKRQASEVIEEGDLGIYPKRVKLEECLDGARESDGGLK